MDNISESNEAPKIAILSLRELCCVFGEVTKAFHISVHRICTERSVCQFHFWTREKATAAAVISCIVYSSFVTWPEVVHFFHQAEQLIDAFLVDPILGLSQDRLTCL